MPLYTGKHCSRLLAMTSSFRTYGTPNPVSSSVVAPTTAAKTTQFLLQEEHRPVLIFSYTLLQARIAARFVPPVCASATSALSSRCPRLVVFRLKSLEICQSGHASLVCSPYSTQFVSVLAPTSTTRWLANQVTIASSMLSTTVGGGLASNQGLVLKRRA